MQCKRCQIEISTPFCPECGNPSTVKRIDWHYVVHDLFHVLHLERGIFSTIWLLLKAPGKTIREFVLEDRTKIVKPVLFLILTSLVYTLFQKFTHLEDQYINVDSKGLTTFPAYLKVIFDWIQSNYGYANLLTSVFIAFWLKVFFRKEPFHFFELMVLLCYAMGMGMVFFFVFAFLTWAFNQGALNQGMTFSLVYIVYAIGSFYGRKGFMPYFKAFWAYFLGFLSFIFIVLGVGLLLDYKAGNLEKLKEQLQKSTPEKVVDKTKEAQ